VHEAHPGISAREVGSDLIGAVRARTERQHDLERAGVVLAEEPLDRTCEMALLVEHGDDHGHAGEVGAAGRRRRDGVR